MTGVQKHSLFHHQTFKPVLHIPTSHAVSINLQGLPGGEQGLKYFLQPGMRCKGLAQLVGAGSAGWCQPGMSIPLQQSCPCPTRPG